MSFEAFFLEAGEGQRFCLFHPARGSGGRGAVVYVHPFAEEMNKSRRMAALQSRALAGAGYAVLQIDLLGCGDSSGDFSDATWDAWVDDVMMATRWLAARSPKPLWLWGLRAGCLLTVEAAQRLEQPCCLLWWQPTTSGKQALQQFLRLRMASDMLNGGSASTTDALRKQLQDGTHVEIAGYRLNNALASGLERARLAPCSNVRRLEWIHVGQTPEDPMPPATLAMLADWRIDDRTVNVRVAAGPQFWHTTEVEEAPDMIDATMAALAVTVET